MITMTVLSHPFMLFFANFCLLSFKDKKGIIYKKKKKNA